MSLEYSAVIRTLGLAGEKYMRLLKSLDNQTIKPKEILVVLAEGYDLPPERLGYERYVFSKKGIVSQRSLGAIEADAEYCLFLDDDLEFEPTMVEKLFEPIKNGSAEVTFPIIPEMIPRTTFKSVFSILDSSSCPILFNRDACYTKVMMNGGWKYNETIDIEHQKCYTAETAPGACYLVKKEFAQRIRFEEEVWLELAAFSLPDDQINFYKYHCLGYRIMGISGCDITHLDGAVHNYKRKQNAVYALSKHHVIFWHRFIYKPSKNCIYKFFSFIYFLYWLIASTLTTTLIYLVTNRHLLYVRHITGWFDGIKYLFNKDYKNLPIVRKENY